MSKSDQDKEQTNFSGQFKVLRGKNIETVGLTSKKTTAFKSPRHYKVAARPVSEYTAVPVFRKGYDAFRPLKDQLYPGINLTPYLSLKGTCLSERDLDRACFNQTDLSHCDLSNSRLRGARFKGCNLNGADLRKACLKNAIFENCSLQGADLRHTSLDEARFIDCDLLAVNFDGSCLKGAAIDSCKMAAQSFHNASCIGVRMSNSQIVQSFLDHANLAGCELKNILFKDCTLSHADFHDGLIDGCQFKGCDSVDVGPVFSGSTLNGVTIEDCDLQVVEWVKTHMLNSLMTRVDMVSAWMEGAYFEKVLFQQGEMKDCYSLDQGPSFNHCHLDQVKINQADWHHANFDSSSFNGVSILDSNFDAWHLSLTDVDSETSVD